MSAVKASGGAEQTEALTEPDHEAEWDCIGTLEGHDSECKSVAFSSTGGLLASCSRDKSVWIWEVQGQAEFDCLSVLMEHSQDVKTVAWHPHEELLASASYDDSIKLYIDDPSEDWFAYSTLTGHKSTIWSLSFSPCGNFLASSSEDLTVRIWRRLTPTQATQRGLQVQGKIDGTREGDRWACVRVLQDWHTRSIYSVSWGYDQRSAADSSSLGRLATAGADGSICVFDVSSDPDPANWTPQVDLVARVWEAHGDADINSVAWAPPSLKPWTQSDFNGEARIREIQEEEASAIKNGGKSTYHLGNLLASAADDGTVKVWSI